MVRCTQVSQEDARFLRLGSLRCICSGRRHGLAPWQGLLAAQIENTFVQVEFDSSQVMREGLGSSAQWITSHQLATSAIPAATAEAGGARGGILFSYSSYR